MSTEEMQRIAAWTNLSETTFVLPASSPRADYRLRIFTPRCELPFAGHPTIGSAHAVLESGYAASKGGQLAQECQAGILNLAVEEKERGTRIFVRAPSAKITELTGAHSDELAAALAVPRAGENGALRVDIGVVWLVVELADANAVAALRPSMEAIAK